MTKVNTSVTSVVDTYLAAFYTGDFATASSVVAEGFSFEGPFITTQSSQQFFERAQGLQAIVRGHRTLRQWIDQGDVCTIFDVAFETPLASGSLTMCEWHNVVDGRIQSGRVLFDAAAFRSLTAPTV